MINKTYINTNYNDILENMRIVTQHVLDHQIHGDFAIQQILNQIDEFNIDDFEFDWNNIFENHNASFKEETLSEDVDLKYNLNLQNTNDSQKYKHLQESLTQCITSLVVLEKNIYRYRNLTDYEAASILVDMRKTWLNLGRYNSKLVQIINKNEIN